MYGPLGFIYSAAWQRAISGAGGLLGLNDLVRLDGDVFVRGQGVDGVFGELGTVMFVSRRAREDSKVIG